jgi:hypothetical protein
MEPALACLFSGLGNPGEDDRGSNGGSSVGAGRFVPAEGNDGSGILDWGDESMMIEPQERMSNLDKPKLRKFVDLLFQVSLFFFFPRLHRVRLVAFTWSNIPSSLSKRTSGYSGLNLLVSVISAL